MAAGTTELTPTTVAQTANALPHTPHPTAALCFDLRDGIYCFTRACRRTHRQSYKSVAVAFKLPVEAGLFMATDEGDGLMVRAGAAAQPLEFSPSQPVESPGLERQESPSPRIDAAGPRQQGLPPALPSSPSPRQGPPAHTVDLSALPRDVSSSPVAAAALLHQGSSHTPVHAPVPARQEHQFLLPRLRHPWSWMEVDP